ncbi:hypothetical protein ACFFIS_17070 [Virgibacillus soli]|uniref:Uncharacterized protein n=1 Tax=Paracerasibacillus soli TaxID=480284 RepID=A0ABU5CT55_9BACI|nr:hypothetical protein [Virgibacillus soli]MDY0409004.1 hypothetical protein [Virgibacillus soli]
MQQILTEMQGVLAKLKREINSIEGSDSITKLNELLTFQQRLMDVFQHIHETQFDVEQEVSLLREENQLVKQDIHKVQKDNQRYKKELARLKKEQAEIRQELAIMRKEYNLRAKYGDPHFGIGNIVH